MTPVWVVLYSGTWWIGTAATNQKVRNVDSDSRVGIALVDAAVPVVAQGRATVPDDSGRPIR